VTDDATEGVAAVLFDMDGVLVDSEDYWVEREREAILPAAVAGEPPAVSEITGMNYRGIYDYLADNYEVAVSKEDFLATFDEAAQEIYGEQVTLLPRVRDLLADLDAADIDRAIVSSSPVAWIDVVVERFGLAEEFELVLSAEAVDGPGKPEPDVFEAAADRLGVPIADCLVVEDSEHGVAAAAASGATTIGYRSGADEEVDLSAADVVVTSPEALDAELRRRTGLD